MANKDDDGLMKIDHSDMARCRVFHHNRRFTDAQRRIIFADLLDDVGKAPHRVGGDDFCYWVDRILDDYFARRMAPTPPGELWQIVEVGGLKRTNEELEMLSLDKLEDGKATKSTGDPEAPATVGLPTVLACKIVKAASLEWRAGLLPPGDEFEAAQLKAAFSDSKVWKSRGTKAPPKSTSAARALIGRKRGIDVRVIAVQQTWDALTKNE